MNNSYANFRASVYMSSIVAHMEASGPVRRKQTLEEYQAEHAAEIADAREQQRAQQQARLAREAEKERLTRPTPAAQAYIAKREKRRAEKKAAKKAARRR